MENNCESMDTSDPRRVSSSSFQGGTQMIEKQLTHNQLENLYESLGITGNEFNRVRFEAIHLRSSNELTVKDVIDYFSVHNPKYVELVDDQSFNIVWYDRSSAAVALYSLSQIVNDTPVRATVQHMFCNMKIPPGNWLIGKGHINLSSVILRFSMKSDARPRTMEVCSKYSRDNKQPVYSEPIDKKNPWGNLSKFWDEKYELSGRDSKRQMEHDPSRRVHLKGRRRNNH